jgi:hypothetical protein
MSIFQKKIGPETLVNQRLQGRMIKHGFYHIKKNNNYISILSPTAYLYFPRKQIDFPSNSYTM